MANNDYMVYGQGIAIKANDDLSLDIKVTPKAVAQLKEEDKSSTGKSYIIAKTMAGYAPLGAGRKIMVVEILEIPKDQRKGK